MPQVFHRLMTPQWLGNARAKNASFGGTSTYVGEDLETSGVTVYPTDAFFAKESRLQSLISAPLVPPKTYEKDADLTISIQVGMTYRQPSDADFLDPEKYGRLAFMIGENARDGYAFGFEVRDPCEFDDWGPYRGIEGVLGTKPSNELSKYAFIPDDRGNLGALEALAAASSDDELTQQAYQEALDAAKAAQPAPRVLSRAEIPERFEITLRPKFNWGRCASAVSGGHSVSVGPFFRNFRPEKGVSMCVFGTRKGSPTFYELKYLEVSIHGA